MKKLITLFLLLPFISQAQSWLSMSPFPGNNDEQAGFVANGKGYVTGAATSLYEYNPVSDTWLTKAAFPGQARNSATAFSIGQTGYITNGSTYTDLWAYDAGSDSWSQKANFPGTGREGGVAATAGGKAYFGLGGSYFNDWYEYNPISDSWSQKAPIPGAGRYHACAFQANGKIYVIGGFGNGTFYNDVFEYNPTTDTWATKSPFPGTARDRQEGVGLNGKGYMYVGWSGSTTLSDCWEYDASNDTWIQLPAVPTGTYNGIGLGIGGSLYCGLGTGGSSWSKLSLCAARTFTVQDVSCFGGSDGSITLNNPSGAALNSAIWTNPIPPITGPTITGITAGTYTCIVTDTAGCVTTESITVNQPNALQSSASAVNNLCNGGNDASLCILISGGTAPYSITWTGSTDSTFCRDQLSAGSYNAIITDANGCSTNQGYTIIDPTGISVTESSNGATCGNCSNGSATVSVNGGNASFQISWSNGAVTFTNNNLTPGWYSYCVTDSNACQYCDSVFVGNLLGLSHSQTAGFFTAPNPTTGEVSISTTANGLIRFKLLDASGRCVQTGSFYKQTKLDLSSLNKGVYVCQIWSEEGLKSLRLVRE
jgi:N-acetylneuraminic acid mutarotase